MKVFIQNTTLHITNISFNDEELHITIKRGKISKHGHQYKGFTIGIGKKPLYSTPTQLARAASRRTLINFLENIIDNIDSFLLLAKIAIDEKKSKLNVEQKNYDNFCNLEANT